MHYGANNRMYWWFSDRASVSHSIASPTNFFNLREWYYIAATVDYITG